MKHINKVDLMKILTKILMLFSIMIGLSSCQIKSNHGNQIPEDEVHKLRTSGATKEDVIQKFGTPTVASMYGQENWFYISRKQYYRAFFSPQVASQQIIQISFDGNKLDKVTLLEDSNNNVMLVREVTPTEGQNVSFMRDFVNNIGKFGRKKKGR